MARRMSSKGYRVWIERVRVLHLHVENRQKHVFVTDKGIERCTDTEGSKQVHKAEDVPAPEWGR